MSPGTSAPVGSLSEKVESFIVDWFICWLKVAETVVLRFIPVAPSAGVIATIAGTGSDIPEPLPHPGAIASSNAKASSHRPRRNLYVERRSI